MLSIVASLSMDSETETCHPAIAADGSTFCLCVSFYREIRRVNGDQRWRMWTGRTVTGV